MIASLSDETEHETGKPKKQPRPKASAGRNDADKGKSAPRKEMRATPDKVEPKAKPARKRTGTAPSTVAAVTAEERWKMIADAAYYRARERGFEPGHEQEDWLLAEREVDSLLTPPCVE